MEIKKMIFGSLDDGREVEQYILTNDNSMEVRILNFGGIISHLLVPDKNGKQRDVVLGFDKLEDYLGEHPFFGALIGRYGNRIKEGKFRLNKKDYKLAINNGPNHLHGGLEGFDKKLWTASREKTEKDIRLHLAFESADLEEGYPGNLMIEVTYSLNNKNELCIDYQAKSDADTIVNLTNHSYFNLRGDDKDILDHELKLDCDYFIPVDDTSIPTGEILKVKNSPFDFTKMKAVRSDFGKMENGYDHTLVINGHNEELNWFGELKENESGIIMKAATTEPGVQLYTANYITGIEGKQGLIYKKNSGICLETQHFPDSPNKLHFPSVVLHKGDIYKQKTIYSFSTTK